MSARSAKQRSRPSEKRNNGFSLAIREADGIIPASPIFFFGLSARTKAMIDRRQAFWCEKYLLKKPISEPPATGRASSCSSAE